MFFTLEHRRCTFLITEIVGGTLENQVTRSPSLGIVHCCFLLRPQEFDERSAVAKNETFGNRGAQALSESSFMNWKSQKSETVSLRRRLGQFKKRPSLIKNRPAVIHAYKEDVLMAMTENSKTEGSPKVIDESEKKMSFSNNS